GAAARRARPPRHGVRRGGPPRGGGSQREGHAGARHDVRRRGQPGAPRRAAGGHGPALSGLLELRHVQELRGARRHLPQTRRGDVTDRRWETRLLAVIAAVLIVLGLAEVYGASSLVTTSGGTVGARLAVRQAAAPRVGVLPFLVIVAPLAGLIFLEPNLSMAVLVVMLAGIVMFAAGARIGHFLLVGIVALPLLFGAVAAAQYRVARELTFLNPGAAPEEASW